MDDKYKFLDGLDNSCNFRLLLLLALEETRGSAHPVVEFGPSEASTPHLHAYCEAEGRRLVSVEEDIFLAGRHLRHASERHDVRCCAWDAFPVEAGTWSVALLDHAPGERRARDIARLADRCEVIVVHDTEPAAESGYRMGDALARFRSRVDVRTGGAWATAVSDSRDLSRWVGERAGGYVVTGPGGEVPDDPIERAVARLVDEAEEATGGQ